VNENEFFQRLKRNNLPVVVDFWAAWCGPCKATEPVLKKVSQEYAGWVDVWKVDVEENHELRASLNILGLPTLIVYRGGQEVTRCTGVASKLLLTQLFESAISGVAPTQSTYIIREQLVRLIITATKFISHFEIQTNSEHIRKGADTPNCANQAKL